MKWIVRYYKGLSIFCFIYGISVILDIYVFKAYLKNLMVKANSSSMSAYNTDGVFNIIVLLFLMIILPLLLYYLICFFTPKEDKKDEDN
jgi:hypothetical protein